jgi:hypothetical protein
MSGKKMVPLLVFFLAATAYAQTDLEDQFNLCLAFGAPEEVVQLFQPFRTYKAETNGTISYVTKEDENALKDSPYSEYQIWYTIDKEEGLYQSSLYIRGENAVLQNIFTSYLKKFSGLYGEPVYTNLDNNDVLVFWYNEETFIVKARLLLDIVNSYKFVSITFCSPYARHAPLLKTLYNGNGEDEIETSPSDADAANTHEKAESVPEANTESGNDTSILY